VSPHRIRTAGVDDEAAVMKLFEARVDWLRSRGSDQWNTVGLWRDKVARNLRIGATRVLCLDGEPGSVVATITLSRRGDPRFWGDTPHDSALYLAKLATDPSYAGRGLGSLLLDWAVDFACRNDLREVRLDAWKTSAGLHRYYRARGWSFLRVVEDEERMSGALFARRSAAIDFRGRLIPTTHRATGLGMLHEAMGMSDDDMDMPTRLIPTLRGTIRPERIGSLI
jgi:GNAT superfamily N-acetyltransferase